MGRACVVATTLAGNTGLRWGRRHGIVAPPPYRALHGPPRPGASMRPRVIFW